jgi:ABC-type uncharacterized transport system permease subunit
MKSLLLAVLAAYLIAAIHSILAFINKRRSVQRVAEWSMALGFILHSIALIADWAIDGHYPLFSLKETLSFLAWALVAAYALILYRYKAQALGVLAMPLISVLTFSALLIKSGPQDTPGFSTTWLFPIHTTLSILAYAAFFMVFMASVLYLLQERELKLKTFGAIFHRLPSLATINQVATNSAILGVTFLTLGIATGMLWSSSRYGRVWHNDLTEIVALLTWILYFALLVYRSSARWRGKNAAWLGVIGFALILCTLFGTFLLGGYHIFGLLGPQVNSPAPPRNSAISRVLSNRRCNEQAETSAVPVTCRLS